MLLIGLIQQACLIRTQIGPFSFSQANEQLKTIKKHAAILKLIAVLFMMHALCLYRYVGNDDGQQQTRLIQISTYI